MTATLGTQDSWTDGCADRRVCRQTGVRLSSTYWLWFAVLHLSEHENVSNIKTLKCHFGACHTLCSVCVCVCSVTYRCWPSPGAVAGTTRLSRRGPGSLGCSARSPGRWCCAHTHTAAWRHVEHSELRAGCTYTCRGTQAQRSVCVLTLGATFRPWQEVLPLSASPHCVTEAKDF